MKKIHLKTINLIMTLAVLAILWQTVSMYLSSEKTTPYQPSHNTKNTDLQNKAIEKKESSRGSLFGSLTSHDKKTTPDFILKGTITANTQLSAAVIELAGNKMQKIYHIGDRLPNGAVITEIKRQYITLDNKNHIWINKHQAKFNDKSRIKQINSRSWEIDKEVISNNLGDINSLLKEIRIIPHFKNNEPNGFLLRDIKTNSFFAEIGIKNEDIIKAINNKEIKSPLEAIKALQVFMVNETNSIKIRVERNKQEIDLHYKIN